MRRQFIARGYQDLIIDFQEEVDRCAVWAEMGLGKTISTLTMVDRRNLQGYSRPTLVLAPLLVAKTTWPDEAKKWAHLRHTRVVPIVGDEAARMRALRTDASIYTANYELLPWLVEYFGDRWPFEQVVADESTRLKSFRLKQGGVRAQALAKVAHTKIRKFVELTGTPSPNGLIDLWGQIWMLDAGKRLGRTFTGFKERWFSTDREKHLTIPHQHASDEIQRVLRDVCLTVKTKDWFDLKDPIVTNVKVKLADKARRLYDEMEENFFIELEGHPIEAFHAASLSQKLLQMANGAIYVDPLTEDDRDKRSKEFKEVHDGKIQALDSIVSEANGKPVLVAYNFKSDLARLKKAFPQGVALNPHNVSEIMREWNKGNIPILFAHPQCLHPDTEVLTEHRGWVRIVDVKATERVYDGVEFVNHKGCYSSGVREVIGKFGFILTPDHRLLINNNWVRAKHVRDNGDTRREASYTYTGDDTYLREMLPLRGRKPYVQAECYTSQQREATILPVLHTGYVSPHDGHKILAHMEGDGKPGYRFEKQRPRAVWGKWPGRVRGLARLQEFLRRHVPVIRGWFNDRTDKQCRRVLQGELSLGHEYGATGQQSEQSEVSLPRKTNASSRILSGIWSYQGGYNPVFEQRITPRSSVDGFSEFEIQKEQKTKACEVYDLVDCGPRSRFLIRNADGDVFVSHNSAGHGLNLQDGGNILVFFGLNWNLEHRLQIIERIGPTRQLQAGHDRPVFIYNILAEDTVDELVLARVETKREVQDILMDAMARRKK